MTEVVTLAVPSAHANLPNDVYHKGLGLSHSGVKRFAKSPWHYHAIATDDDQPPTTPSPQMLAGTLCHCATLEPDQFDKRYRVGPEVNKNSREWKDFKARNPDSEIISVQQRDVAFAQAKSLRAHPLIGELLARGVAELSLYWRDPPTNILCKARPDWVHHCGTTERPAAILVDVKTTSDASAEGFAKAVASYSYHTQADWYCMAHAQVYPDTRCEGMVFAVVENEFPYACAAFMLDDQALAIAKVRNRAALTRYAECQRQGAWPGYPSDLQVISLPRWELARGYD